MINMFYSQHFAKSYTVCLNQPVILFSFRNLPISSVISVIDLFSIHFSNFIKSFQSQLISNILLKFF